MKELQEIKEKQLTYAQMKEVMVRHDMDKENIEILRKKIEEDRVQLIKDTVKSEDVLNQARELNEKLGKFNSKEIENQIFNGETIINLITKNREESVRNLTLAQKAQETVQDGQLCLKTLVKDTKITKGWIDDLLLLKEALSPRGVKAVAIDYLIPQLEERINTVLCQMSDFKIRLDTQKATADEEGVKEGLFITVINDQGQEMSYESYSGGEKSRITISISEGLATLLTSSIGFRIMDEIIIGLNPEMITDFVSVLTKLQEKYQQIIFISHIPEAKEIFENSITVIKTNGISKIFKNK
jgi:DNA repair exonuclease SbcCD ATPase subunit